MLGANDPAYGVIPQQPGCCRHASNQAQITLWHVPSSRYVSSNQLSQYHVVNSVNPPPHCFAANTFLTPLIDANSICCTNCWPPQQEKRTAEHTPGISEPEAALNIHSPMKLVH
eukprot:GHRR01014453.1.p2 GENE.GHRR01014453.1~~GHRR01014453.1.p2  ORF type:complete len:114 (+),score=10.88 GHRR01014453.1:558-899(+)